jgi:hypothetical protein
MGQSEAMNRRNADHASLITVRMFIVLVNYTAHAYVYSTDIFRID